MTLDEYARHLGGLLTNYHGLEFFLRLFLLGLEDAQPIGLPHGTDVYSLPVGTDVPLSDLTSYDSLGNLIDKYNDHAEEVGLSTIDRSLVDVRDALAHGRVSATDPSDIMRLIKFSRPNNGSVTVTFNAVLSEEWFKEQKRRVLEPLFMLAKYHQTRSQQEISSPHGATR